MSSRPSVDDLRKIAELCSDYFHEFPDLGVFDYQECTEAIYECASITLELVDMNMAWVNTDFMSSIDTSDFSRPNERDCWNLVAHIKECANEMLTARGENTVP